MIADPEKAIIDSVYINIFIEETKEILHEYHEKLELDKMIEYAYRMKSRATLNKVGFLMEKYAYYKGSITPIRSGRYVKIGDNCKEKNAKWKVMYAD